MENVKINTEIEAFEFCKENQCRIEFRKAMNGTPAHVIVKMGLSIEVIGEDLVEAVNRVIDMYFTPPIEHEKLSWWEEQENFYSYR